MGASLMQVNDDSPAEKEEIAAGDVILQVNGEAVANSGLLQLWRGPGAVPPHGDARRQRARRRRDRSTAKYMRRKP
jgi:C-terminal processing protease CtpA/Prc